MSSRNYVGKGGLLQNKAWFFFKEKYILQIGTFMKYPISLILFRCGVIDKTLRSKLFRHNNIVKIEKAINEMRRVFNILVSSKWGKLDSLTEIRVLDRDDILLHEIVRKLGFLQNIIWIWTKEKIWEVGHSCYIRFPSWLRCNWQTLKNSHRAIKSL